MAVARIRRKAGSYLPFLVMAGSALIAGELAKSLGSFLTIFAVVVWAVAALLAIYMVLFRNVRFTLWSDFDEDGELVEVPDAAPAGSFVLADGDVATPVEAEEPAATVATAAPDVARI